VWLATLAYYSAGQVWRVQQVALWHSA